MKKILVLVMYCNTDFFIQEELLVRETWAKPVFDGEFPNIMYISYTASNDGKYHYNESEKRVYVPCDDSLYGTAEKTIKCLKFLREIGVQFDCMLRTNTSTYYNLQLFNEFAQTLYNDDIIWCGGKCIPFLDTGPYRYCTLFGGNAVILSNLHVDKLLDKELTLYAFDHFYDHDICNRYSMNQEATYIIDDNYMSFILNTDKIRKHQDHHARYKNFGIIGNDSYIDFNPYEKNVFAVSYRFINRDKSANAEFEYAKTICQTWKEKKNLDLYEVYEIANDDSDLIISFDDETLTPRKREWLNKPESREYREKYGIIVPYSS